MLELEPVQQLARSRGLRIRVENDDTVESRTYTLVEANNLPTQLYDVSLAVIAAELAKPQLWAQLEPTWKSLLPQPQSHRSRPIQYRPGPLHDLWTAMQVEALARFDRQGGPPDNRAEFSRRLRAWCQHQHGRAPKDPKQVSKRIREWLEQWQKMRAAELTAPAPARACGKMGRPRPEPWGWHPHKPGAAQSDAAAR